MNIQSASVNGKGECGALRFSYAQSIGKRERQEDAIGITTKGERLCAMVFDGMGGYSGGAESSAAACSAALACEGNPGDWLDPAFIAAEQGAKEIGRQDGFYKAGTTAVAVEIQGRSLRYRSCGDSLLLHYRSASGELLVANTLHRAGRYLLSAMGAAYEDIEVDAGCLQLQDGDVIILASDGIEHCLEGHELREVMCRADGANLAQDLAAVVLGKHLPRQDNVSIVAIECRFSA